MRAALVFLTMLICVLSSSPGQAQDDAQKAFIGSDACKDCHPDQFATYSKYSKKAHSSNSVKIMASDLTTDELASCYSCHTTGYGQPGGFVSFEQTPDLANAGCEVCHGPGSAHVEAGGDPSLIKGKLTMADCETCHNEERVRSFNFKPMLFAGAH